MTGVAVVRTGVIWKEPTSEGGARDPLATVAWRAPQISVSGFPRRSALLSIATNDGSNVMRACLLCALLAVQANEATAASKFSSSSMSCAALGKIIEHEGAVILRYPSRKVPGLTLYDRYVRDASYCSGTDTLARAAVPANDDKSCPVFICRTNWGRNPR